MKKLILTLATTMLLASCGGNTSSSASSELPYELDLAVVCPVGAPAVALAPHLKSNKVEINADPANVVAYLTDGSGKDVVICPTNAGVNAITKKNAPYLLAATVTFGNFYLASTGHDDDGVLDADDYVVVFQQNNVPDKLFQYVYGDLALQNVHYVDAASNAAQVLISGKNVADNNAEADYVLMAEPALATALSKNEKAKQYADIQEEYKKKSGGEIVQASIFVHKDVKREKASAFLSSVSGWLDTFLNTPTALDKALEGIEEKTAQSKFSATPAVLKTMVEKSNRMGLGYKEAKQNKTAVENFVKLFGINELDEKVYF